MARKPADLSDLANRSNAALSKVMIAIVPLGVALLIAVVAFGAHEKRAPQSVEARASAATFLVSGPPCANATEQDLDAAHLRPVRSVDFNGVIFARKFGHAECAWVETDQHRGRRGYSVCRFTGPGGLLVQTERGAYGFRLDAGKPATVAIIDGAPPCVVGGMTVPQMLSANRAGP